LDPETFVSAQAVHSGPFPLPFLLPPPPTITEGKTYRFPPNPHDWLGGCSAQVPPTRHLMAQGLFCPPPHSFPPPHTLNPVQFGNSLNCCEKIVPSAPPYVGNILRGAFPLLVWRVNAFLTYSFFFFVERTLQTLWLPGLPRFFFPPLSPPTCPNVLVNF